MLLVFYMSNKLNVSAFILLTLCSFVAPESASAAPEFFKVQIKNLTEVAIKDVRVTFGDGDHKYMMQPCWTKTSIQRGEKHRKKCERSVAGAGQKLYQHRAIKIMYKTEASGARFCEVYFPRKWAAAAVGNKGKPKKGYAANKLKKTNGIYKINLKPDDCWANRPV